MEMAPEQNIVTVFDLMDGSSRPGVLVETDAGQIGVFAGWPRDFVWNRPAAATLGSGDYESPTWVGLRTIEVVRHHADPEAGIATITFGGSFDIHAPVFTPTEGVGSLLAQNGGDWAAALAKVSPIFADLPQPEECEHDSPPPLPHPDAFPPAYVKEVLGEGTDASWRICKLLMLC